MATGPEVRVRNPALPDFLRSSGSGKGPLSLVSTIEELLGRNSSGSSRGNRDYGRGDPSRWPHGTLYPQKLALTSPTSGGRTAGIFRSRTKSMELLCNSHILNNRRAGSDILFMIPAMAAWDNNKPLREEFCTRSLQRWYKHKDLLDIIST
jgi:hypothetical protein